LTFLQAVVYFLREAVVSLLRSWKVSLLAILTISVSLFIGGVFLLSSANLAYTVERWRSESKVIVYLEPGAAAEQLAEVAAEVPRSPWVKSVETVGTEEARRRFQQIFPSLSDLVSGSGDEPLPPSVEIGIAGAGLDGAAFDGWVGKLRSLPSVSMVDDDRDWLRQLETVVDLVRGVGLALGLLLLAAAVFTIASIIRLTAYLYHEEIGIMRLVGATEFFIRGPFYAEGLMQGLFGGLLALGALWAAFYAVGARGAESALVRVLTGRFLSPGEAALLVLLGGGAGLAGAVVSLRRERLEG
jgi:cell division transport system permease protein